MPQALMRRDQGLDVAAAVDVGVIELGDALDRLLLPRHRALEGVEGVAVARFTAADVVRHPLVERIVRAYDADAAKRGRTV